MWNEKGYIGIDLERWPRLSEQVDPNYKWTPACGYAAMDCSAGFPLIGVFRFPGPPLFYSLWKICIVA